MKRILAVLTAFLLIFLTSCAAEAPAEEGSEQVFRATVLSVGDGFMVVEPAEGEEELRAADQITVALEHMDPSPEPQIGDTVEISYNGEILESYPAQLGEVYGITVVEQAEEKTEAPESAQTVLPPCTSEDPATWPPECIEYGYDDVYMALELPADWDYEVHSREELQETNCCYTCAIDFWPREQPDLIFELAYWPSFGMCGTGVTIEELTLSDGRTAWQYTETHDGTVWLTVAFADTAGEGRYVIDASPTEDQWAQYADAFYSILETVACGAA